MLVPTILIGAFLMSSVVYFVIVALGVLQAEARDPSGQPLWWVLCAAAAGLVPLQVILSRQLLAPVRRAKSFDAVMARALVPLIASLAVGEAAVILGMMTVLLKAPEWIAYLTMGGGVLFMMVSALGVRGRIVEAALLRLRAEKKK
jgi:hypothetical protein